MTFYTDMQAIASDVMAEFKQGVCTLSRTTTAPNVEEPWEPDVTTTVVYPLDAAVSAVTVDQANAKFIDGTVITTADLVLTCAVPAITPAMSDTLTIDGLVRTIKKIVQVPAAGTAVAFKLFIQG